MIGMADIGDLRRDDVRFGRAGIEKKLVDLMRTDVAQDAAILHIFPEPTGRWFPPPLSPARWIT
jgi:hypothetical protein